MMLIDYEFDDKRLLIIPAIIAFFMGLLLLYKFSYPISWDVYYHVHMIDLYMRNSLVFWDYETVAPMGRLIMYPPLFHLVLSSISSITNIEPMQLCRLLQPFFGFFLIGVITYVSYLLSDVKTAFFTSFLSLLSFVTFNRSLICTPATIAIALSMITIVFLYQNVNLNSKKYLIISAIILAIIFNLHMATAIITTGVIALSIFYLLVIHKITLKDVAFYVIISIILSMPWWLYVDLNYGLFFASKASVNISLYDFIWKCYGIIPFIFTLLGYYALFKDYKSDKSILLIIWSLSIVFLSQVYLIGIDTVSIRILEVASYPMILIAGIGLVYTIEYIIKNKKINLLICIFIIVFSSLSALAYTDTYTPDLMDDDDITTQIMPYNLHLIIDYVGTTYKPSIISSRYSPVDLARSRYDVIIWLKQHNNDSKIIVSEDAIMDTIIVSTTRRPVIYGGFTESIPEYVVDPQHIVHNQSTPSELKDLNVKYILIKNDTPTPYYSDVIYNNPHYKLCEVNI